MRRRVLGAVALVVLIVTLVVWHSGFSRTPSFAPTVEVPVDYSEVESWQFTSDQGHMPWRVNPVSVAEVFLKQMEEEIVFDYDDVQLEWADKGMAIVSIDSGYVERVYLRRAYPEKEGSIWLVVGYDPR